VSAAGFRGRIWGRPAEAGLPFEQDTFTANGKTLVSEPYSIDARWFVDSNGNLTKYVSTGPVERVWLPDGSLFNSAGRIIWLGPNNPPPLIVPDVGHSGNVAGFCAALAP
jgi:hypothetical protein